MVPDRRTDLESMEDNPNWPLPLVLPAAAASEKSQLLACAVEGSREEASDHDRHSIPDKSANAKVKRHYKQKWILLGLLLGLILVLALALGLIYGLRQRKSNKSGSASTCVARNQRSFLRQEGSWQGANLGNWLLLERWMNPSYYAFYTGIGQTDEWSFCKSLGDQCGPVLEAHWNDFLTESDIATLARNGVNLLRLPIGFWAFMRSYPWEPYYTGSQLEQVDRVLGYADKYNMSVILDLHGLPGSQNGKDHSGHAGPINFFNSTNQARAEVMLDSVLQYMNQTSNRHVITALEVANEPDLYIQDNMKVYKDYLRTSYGKLLRYNAESGSNLTLMFHDGFVGAKQFQSLFDTCDNVVVDYHQYYTNSTAYDSQSVLSTICSPLPNRDTSLDLFYGEWSLSFEDYNSDSFYQQLIFGTQAMRYASTTGSAFWNFKAFNEAGSGQVASWSILGLFESSSVSHNSSLWQPSSSVC